MKSMTGYGRADVSKDKNTVSVEITAVNSRKQAEMRFTMPRELASMESQFRKIVQKNVSRGNLNITICYQLDAENSEAMSGLDYKKALQVAEQLKRLASDAILTQGPLIGDILTIPGVLNTQNILIPDILLELIPQALEQALKKLCEMRIKEGEELKKDLLLRGENVGQFVNAIEAQGGEALIQQQKRLKERIKKLGVELTMDDERLAKELVFYAERSDITEEVVRLKSHLQQYTELLNSEHNPGRNLDFLGQEMNREITTLSSKTVDLSIAQYAFKLKSEIAKIREQVLNIE
ncbi:MAG: YicC/YloC family endoribonuclease [Lentisphaeria bacterium]